MFSYMYADGRNGMNYAIAAKTQDGINRLALEYMNTMLGNEGYIANSKPAPPEEVQAIYDAIDKKDIDKAIAAWDTYATVTLKQVVTCHKIEQFNIVE
jgi:hypothetical protein